MQKLGQHFLINKAALRKIAEAVDVQDGDTIVEIGPGHGELTEELLNATSDTRQGKKIVKIIAIEKDPTLAQELRKNFQFSISTIGNEEKFNKNKFSPSEPIDGAKPHYFQSISNNQFSKLEIIEGDARVLLPNLPTTYNLPPTTYKIVGNIPYYLTGYLLRIISEMENKPSLCVFTIQKEVAERIVAQPPKMNRLAASVQFWAEPKILQILPRRDFKPAPKVDSATLLLTTEGQAPESQKNAYFSTVKLLFQQPRKTILNNLSTGLHTGQAGLPTEQTDSKTSREEIEIICKKTGINPSDRPQNLTVEEIKKLSEIFSVAD